MTLSTLFKRGQTFPKSAALCEAITGTSSADTNKHIATYLLPPFPPSSQTHNNGFIFGQVEAEIMGTSPQSSIQTIAASAKRYALNFLLSIQKASETWSC